MNGFRFVLCALLFAVLTDCAAAQPRIVDEVTLWKRGDKEVDTYRIPIITSLPDGSLMALSEGRKHSPADSGPKYLAVRRSSDQGSTWTPTAFIEDDREYMDGLNLGTILVDEVTNTVFVIYSFCAHKCQYHTTYLIRSDDFGTTWTKPLNLSSQIGTWMFAPGPGFGIQKKRDPYKGRLISCGHSTAHQDDGVFCIVSDDHGDNWTVAGKIPQEGSFEPNESQLVELWDGMILMTSRNENHDHCRCRIMSKSYDGAESFAHSDIYYDETLVDPTVAASLLFDQETVFFSNPANQKLRVNMTVRWSVDNATSWIGALSIWEGPSGYSCLTAVPQHRGAVRQGNFIGLVFEKGSELYYETIVFIKIEV